MQSRVVLLVVGVGVLATGESFGQKYAARVVKPDRYAEGPAPDPNQIAKDSDQGRTSGPLEEDLAPPAPGAKKKARPLPAAPKALPKTIEEPQSPRPPHDLPRIPKSEDGPPPTLPPEFRPRPEDQEHAGDIDDEGDIGFSLGIGFGSKKFAGTLGLVFPIYKWLAWNVSGAYETWVDGDDKQTRYGPETSLMLRLQSRIPLTPFAGAGLGYDHWTRTQLGEKFDDTGSLLSLYYVGISIPMAKRLAIDISETWRTYLETAPRRFDDHNKRERYGSTRFDVGLSVHF